MAKFTKDEFISGLKEMTILEVKELVDAMKEEFGVDPSAVAVAAPAAGAAVEEGPSTANVVLVNAGASKLAVIKFLYNCPDSPRAVAQLIRPGTFAVFHLISSFVRTILFREAQVP